MVSVVRFDALLGGFSFIARNVCLALSFPVCCREKVEGAG